MYKNFFYEDFLKNVLFSEIVWGATKSAAYFFASESQLQQRHVEKRRKAGRQRWHWAHTLLCATKWTPARSKQSQLQAKSQRTHSPRAERELSAQLCGISFVFVDVCWPKRNHSSNHTLRAKCAASLRIARHMGRRVRSLCRRRMPSIE